MNRRPAFGFRLSAMPDLSIVIPAYNEAQYLPRLLDTIDAARARYSGGGDAIEVIVADNSSTDDTAAIAAARGCRVAAVTKRMIGAARNGGAAIATAPIIGFVDADMQIHPDTFNAITRAMADSRFVGGATGVTMERWSLGIAVTFGAAIGLMWATGMDTGVVFCRRDDFQRIGGYAEHRHYAEDIDFLWKLIKLGRTRRQRLTRLRPVKAVASTRKWDRHGDWHFFALMLPLLRGMVSPARSGSQKARDYWYNDR
jgi:glycosyltransferase involved in cell wall biosynthesis